MANTKNGKRLSIRNDAVYSFVHPSTQSTTALAVGECVLLRMSARMGVVGGATGLVRGAP